MACHKSDSWITWRICVAAAGALFLMTLMFIDMGRRETLFPVGQFWVATGVQFFAGYPFYKGAFSAIRRCDMNMDTLISLGTSAAYLFSIYHLWIGDLTQLYFETSSVIICFVLIGRVIEEGVKKRAKRDMHALYAMQVGDARLLKEGKEVEAPIEKVAVSDIAVILPGERFPIDGILRSGQTVVDESMLNGESIPKEKQEGDPIFAGTVNQGSRVEVRVEKTGAKTALGKLIEHVDASLAQKAPMQTTIDRMIRPFVLSVLGIAILTWILWVVVTHSVGVGLIAAVSVLVIACPCAIGLATPTVVLAAASKASKEGILIKDFAALELASHLDALLIDKTGVVTRGEAVVCQAKFHEISELQKALIAFAANASTHPYSKAIARYFAKIETVELSTIPSTRELPGKGVELEYEGVHYFLGSDAKRDRLDNLAQGVVAFFMGDKLLAEFYLEDPIKEGTKQAIEVLRSGHGVYTKLISGDRQGVVHQTAEAIGAEGFLAECSPDRKAKEVEKYQEEKGVVGMIGDGVNDALALSKADVGIAVFSGSDIAMETAGIGFMHSHVSSVPSLMLLGKRTKSKLKQNIFFAFFYNTLALPIAAFGLLNPMIASLAMVLSSLTVLSNALLLKRG